MKKERKIDGIKKRFAPWFQERGFISNYRKRIWYYDCGFCLIVFEIQPLHDIGFFLNTGIRFLWTNSTEGIYQYTVYGGRAHNPEISSHEYILFESDTIEEEIAIMLRDAERHIEAYKQLLSREGLLNCILNRDDLRKYVYKDWYEWDTNLGIAKMLNGDEIGGRTILSNPVNQKDSVALLLLECKNLDDFEEELLRIINECRVKFSAIRRIKLPTINTIFKE